MRIAVAVPIARLLDEYEAQCGRYRDLVASLDLDTPSKRPVDGRPVTLRWILFHLVEETARHNGHLDILRELVREVALALKHTASFDSARGGVELVAGNHAIVQGADTIALFAHLAPGTVSVTTGPELRAGEVLGRVGHTGDSTAPKLHFQLMDSADPVQAKGIPYAFAECLVRRARGWERVEGGIPGLRERIRSDLDEST